jgi:hypothetical protein
MTILTRIRDRFSGSSARSGTSQPPDNTRAGTAPAGTATEGQLPFEGYDGFDQRQVMNGLSDHSQVELEAVEGYERSHKDREPVLDKLRYMRGREPLPGYDALDVEEILAALEQADLATIKRVRAYERKFANRPAVLEEVVRVRHRWQETHPATAAPAYQPLSAASAAPRRGDRTEKVGRP